jgi:glycine oxidase
MRDMDVVIVGGGVMGCGIALRLRQAGARVTVLERSIPGAEASSAAGGILAPQMEAEGPGPFLELCLRSRGLYPDFAAELQTLTGVNVNYLPSGLLNLAFDEAGAQRLEATVGWQRALGLRAELLGAREVHRLEPQLSDALVAAARFPEDHQVDNRLLTRALTMAAARVGATFRTGYVRGVVEAQGRAVGVDLDGETLRADAVVIAAGLLVRPRAGHRIGPARGASGPRADGAAADAAAALLPRRLLRQGLPHPPGGRPHHRRQHAGVRRLREARHRRGPPAHPHPGPGALPRPGLGPGAGDLGGLRPYTDDHLPILGAGPLPGLFLATGHFRNGILLAPLTARSWPRWYSGNPPRWTSPPSGSIASPAARQPEGHIDPPGTRAGNRRPEKPRRVGLLEADPPRITRRGSHSSRTSPDPDRRR